MFELARSPEEEALDELGEKLRSRGPLLGDQAEIMDGLTPFEPLRERPSLNGLAAFTGFIRRYEMVPGPLGFIRYDKRLTEFRPLRCFSGPRLLLNACPLGGRLACAFTDETQATSSEILTVLPRERDFHPTLLLGFLNSRIAAVTARKVLPEEHLSAEEALDLPLPVFNVMNRRDRGLQGEIISAIYRLSHLCRERKSGKPEWANRVVDRQIQEADRVVDRLFAKAFGLDDRERALLGIDAS